MIKEYLKLARISIASITGLAPVMGSLATGQYQGFHLLLLFIVGFFGHAYGMTHNDLIDYKIDKKSSEIADRPLISGKISLQQARIFALSCLLMMFIFAFVLAGLTAQYLPIFLLIIPATCVTLYNIYGKKVPFADIFLAIGMFFFILYGALSQQFEINNIPLLVWIICLLGTIQMLSINVIQGGFKDVENDKSQGARTGAMILGLRIIGNKVYVSKSFMFIAVTMQLLNICIAYLPFVLIPNFASQNTIRYLLIFIITLVGISTLYITYKYLVLENFNRGRIRMLFNLQGYINFTLAPVLLTSITLFAILIIPIPIIGFYISSFLYKEKFMQPTSM